MRVLIIFNPTARRAGAGVQPAVDLLRSYGWTVQIAPTSYAGHATLLARQARAGWDVVVAAGGDGTLNEVVNGLAGSEVAVGILPLGTVNVWAREVGIRGRLLEAAAVLLTGQRWRVDLGQAGERYFLLMAGVGFDAEVVAGMRGPAKRWFGALPYVAHGAWVALRERPWQASVRTAAGSWAGEATWIVIGNTRLYGGAVPIAADADAADGLLDMVIFGRAGPLTRLAWSLAALRGRHTRLKHITYRRVDACEITTVPSRPVQVDGEALGATPVTIRCVPAALTVIVPKRVPPAQFAAGKGK